MIEEIKRQFTSTRILITLLIIAVGAYVLQLLWSFLNMFSDVIIILISAWLISFILEPLVEKLRILTKLPKTLAAISVYIAFFALLIAIVMYFIPVVSAQTQGLVQVLPHYVATAPPFLHKWVDIATSYLDNSLPIISGVAQFVFDLFLALVISFYFVIDKDVINKEFYNLTPKKWRRHLVSTQLLIDTTFASFLRMQLVFAILSGIGTWIVLRIFNVDFAASIALLAGILTLIPLIGPALALIPPLLLPALTNTTQAIFIFIMLILIQQIIFSIIGPKLMSKAFKLHPVIVLLSFIVGYKVAGGLGAIFAVPVLGIVAVLLHKVGQHYMEQNQS
jgi:predicted PurR-regulated permease PerM